MPYSRSAHRTRRGALAAVAQEVPTISEASGDSGRKLLIADFYRADHVTVVVPAYEGMAAPSLSQDHTQVAVRFPAMDVGYHANVQLQGATTLDLPRKDVVSKDVLTLRIPDTWLAANRGRDILVIYAVASREGRDRWQFSRVLRVRL
ncbi:hypothetical protein [Luteibacter jiangsuensis]